MDFTQFKKQAKDVGVGLIEQGTEFATRTSVFMAGGQTRDYSAHLGDIGKFDIDGREFELELHVTVKVKRIGA